MVGCGGDDEPEPAAPPAQTVPADPAPGPVTQPPPETPGLYEEDARIETVTEDQQGDEEAIRSEAVFTGRGGRLSPRVVRVPAYIAVRVVLRSKDAGGDQPYSLTIEGRRLFLGHTRSVDAVELPGLLPNRSYTGRSPQGNVRIEATAEPGP